MQKCKLKDSNLAYWKKWYLTSIAYTGKEERKVHLVPNSTPIVCGQSAITESICIENDENPQFHLTK